MKQSFSLVEVLVAVSLISTVIVTTLQMQQNNIFFLEKFKESSTQNSYISLATSSSKTLRNKKIILSDVVNFNDDDIRKELKDIRVKVVDSKADNVKIPKNDFLEGKVIQSTYSTDKVTKIFYTFKLIEKGE